MSERVIPAGLAEDLQRKYVEHLALLEVDGGEGTEAWVTANVVNDLNFIISKAVPMESEPNPYAHGTPIAERRYGAGEAVSSMESEHVHPQALSGGAGEIAGPCRECQARDARVASMESVYEKLKEALEHIAGQQTILIGNPYNSFARTALASSAPAG